MSSQPDPIRPGPSRRACPHTDVDLWADDILIDPYDTYSALRELAPILWMPRHEAYVVTRYDEVRTVLQDWRTFTSAEGVGMTPAMNAKHGGILTTDPPQHDSLRGVLNTQLVAGRLTPHHDFLVAEAERLVTALVERGSFEVVAELARPYSVKVVADLVGFPEEGRDTFIEWADAAFNTFGPDDGHMGQHVEGLRGLLDYCASVATRDRLAPGGWGQQILDAGDRGDIAPDDCMGLLLAYAWAGMDTTVNAISAAVKLFSEHPDQWTTLSADRSLMGSAINEVIRIEPPVHRFTRAATVSTELAGVAIPAGARVAVLFGAANRDPRRFVDPDRFDITRNPTTHLSFGRGVHRCVGATLAQQEITAVLDALLEQVDKIETTDYLWRRNKALHGLERLHVSVHSKM